MLSGSADKTIRLWDVARRQEIRRILALEDPRFLMIVGPCSIHDLKAGRDYARRLSALAREAS